MEGTALEVMRIFVDQEAEWEQMREDLLSRQVDECHRVHFSTFFPCFFLPPKPSPSLSYSIFLFQPFKRDTNVFFIQRPTMDSTMNCWLDLLLFFFLLILLQSQSSHHHRRHCSQGPLVHFCQKMKSSLKEHGPREHLRSNFLEHEPIVSRTCA